MQFKKRMGMCRGVGRNFRLRFVMNIAAPEHMQMKIILIDAIRTGSISSVSRISCRRSQAGASGEAPPSALAAFAAGLLIAAKSRVSAFRLKRSNSYRQKEITMMKSYIHPAIDFANLSQKDLIVTSLIFHPDEEGAPINTDFDSLF